MNLGGDKCLDQAGRGLDLDIDRVFVRSAFRKLILSISICLSISKTAGMMWGSLFQVRRLTNLPSGKNSDLNRSQSRSIVALPDSTSKYALMML